MLTNLLLLIIDAVTGFLSVTLLARFYMQWQRVSFRNQMGQFVMAVTDWLVLPLRRFVPATRGLDWASLLPAIVLQGLAVVLMLSLRSIGPGGALHAVLGVLLLGSLEVVKMFIYLLIGVVLLSVVLSWVNPYAPIAPVLNSLSRPFLEPFQKVLPTLGNVDLSPLVLLLVLQILLMVQGSLFNSVLAALL